MAGQNMLKYLTHKLRTQSINEDNNNVHTKLDGHDSGTESDGDLDPDEALQEHVMEIGIHSRALTNTQSSLSLMSANFNGYDHHSSEEELEVINGPLSNESEEYDSPKRSSSTLGENRKRSLPHSSDEEFSDLLENAPVNFRTSPPLEAFKPHRGHMQRASTPLVLAETGHGIESIKISGDSPPALMDHRSDYPPAKLFHSAHSPRRRPPRHTSQKLQRHHRPCLDFDKMQQLKVKSITAWRHNNELNTGELSVYCW